MSSETASTHTPPPPPIDRAAIAKSLPRVQSSARWFWWIAGLSLVNTLVVMFDGDFNFVLGLAATQIVDGVFHEFKVLALVFDLFALGFFFAAGLLAAKGHLWAFWVGAIAYLIDGLVFAFFGDWLPAGFHAYALFCIFQGITALRAALRDAATKPAAAPIPTPPPLTAPSPTPLPSEPQQPQQSQLERN